jgi:hypothetical protein
MDRADERRQPARPVGSTDKAAIAISVGGAFVRAVAVQPLSVRNVNNYWEFGPSLGCLYKEISLCYNAFTVQPGMAITAKDRACRGDSAALPLEELHGCKRYHCRPRAYAKLKKMTMEVLLTQVIGEYLERNPLSTIANAYPSRGTGNETTQ